MKIDLDRLEAIERSVIYIKPHKNTIVIDGKDYVLISANAWTSVQRALDSTECSKTEYTPKNWGNKEDTDAVDLNKEYVEEFKKETLHSERKAVYTDAEGETHPRYPIGYYVMYKTSNQEDRLGIVVGNSVVGQHDVALFEKQVNKSHVAPNVLLGCKNTFLSQANLDQINDPAFYYKGHSTSLNGMDVMVMTPKGSVKGYIVGTFETTNGRVSRVYFAATSENGKMPVLKKYNVSYLLRTDGTRVKAKA